MAQKFFENKTRNFIFVEIYSNLPKYINIEKINNNYNDL